MPMSNRRFLDNLEMPAFPGSEIRGLASSHLARLVLLKEGPRKTGSFSLTISFLRLNRFFDGVCHLENCLVSIHRSLLFMQQIRRLGLLTHNNVPIVIRVREWKVLRA